MSYIISMLSVSIIVCIWFAVCSARTLNVALHAQVMPTKNKVVGSVITTDGLKAALQQRFDIDQVETFYPASYSNLLLTAWDLIVIEGWFPSIDEFIQLSRVNLPQVVIMFYCLDPTYPGMDIVSKLNVDGLLTNSKKVLQEYRNKLPIEYMQLAADTNVMRPFPNISKTYGSVYVGAGGHMLQYKHKLRSMLLDAAAASSGMRLHGMGWESVPELKEIAQGVLPRDELALAYASAHVVLAATIDSQKEYGMVNNRIFEALSCGAIVVSSEFSPELEELAPGVIQFVNESTSPSSFRELINNILGAAGTTSTTTTTTGSFVRDAAYFDSIRMKGRDLIVNGHTWQHRAVQVMSFYRALKATAHYTSSATPTGTSSPAFPSSASVSPDLSATILSSYVRDHGHPSSAAGSSGDTGELPIDWSSPLTLSNDNFVVPRKCTRSNCPRMLLVVDSALLYHSDFTHVVLPNIIVEGLSPNYVIDTVSQQQWLDIVHSLNTVTKDKYLRISPSSSLLSVSPAAFLIFKQIADYSVVLSVVRPFSPLDIAMHRFSELLLLVPEKVMMTSSHPEEESMTFTQPRLAAYAMGADISLVKKNWHIACPSLDASPSLHTVGKAPCIYSHYDMIMVRDHLALQDILNYHGTFVLPTEAGRVQHVFGVGSVEPVQITKDSVTTVTVCFVDDMKACTRKQRDDAMIAALKNAGKRSGKKDSKIDDSSDDRSGGIDMPSNRPKGTAVLLLVGGDWQSWVSSGAISASETTTTSSSDSLAEISNIIHVRGNTGRDRTSTTSAAVNVEVARHAVGLIQSSEILIVMTSPSVVDDDDDNNDKETTSKGKDVVIWPLIAAVVSNLSVHLSEYNEKMVRIVSYDPTALADSVRIVPFGPNEWDSQIYVKTQLKFTLSRLLGQPTARSAVKLTQRMRQTQAPQQGRRDRTTTDHPPISDLKTSLKIVGNYYKTLELDYQLFIPGTDGQLCFLAGDSTHVFESGNPSTSERRSVSWSRSDNPYIVLLVESEYQCLMRKYPQIILHVIVLEEEKEEEGEQDRSLRFNVADSALSALSLNLDIEASLRGNVYADIALKEHTPVIIPLVSSASETVDEFVDESSSSSDIFQYEVVVTIGKQYQHQQQLEQQYLKQVGGTLGFSTGWN